MDLVCAPRALDPSPQALLNYSIQLFLKDQNKEGKALQEGPKPSGDMVFHFQPLHALTPGSPPETFQWEVGSQRPQKQASMLKMLVESGLSYVAQSQRWQR